MYNTIYSLKMPRRIILLNGPPRSGKDEAAKIILNKCNSLFFKKAENIRLADPLLQCLHSMFPQVTDYESQKADVICGDLTPRQWIISFAEEFAKKKSGKDTFVNIALEKIKRGKQNTYFVVPDLGFDEEIDGFIEFAQQNADVEIILIRMHREGYDFKGDSRKYIYADDKHNIEQADIYNYGTLPELKNKILKLFAESIKTEDSLPSYVWQKISSCYQ